MPITLKPFQVQTLSAFLKPVVHVICVAPTGSGKSLIFEMLSLNHRVILVAPLLALIRQHRDKCAEKKIPVGQAAPPEAHFGIWILSPESLRSLKVRNDLKKWKPTLLVVDECHCLWEWGLNFRPDFLRIPKLIQSCEINKSLWLTATLPSSARKNLLKELPVDVLELGRFSLPKNVEIQIERRSWATRFGKLMTWLPQDKTFGMIFAATRDGTERLSRILNSAGISSICYHAGLSSEERRNIEKLIHAQKVQLVVATSAFGMGMDYPHLQFVILWQAQPTLLSFVQAIGRAGRSGTKARALVLWDDDDFKLLEWQMSSSRRQEEELLHMRNYLHLPDACRNCYLNFYFNGDEFKEECQRCLKKWITSSTNFF